MAGSVSDQMTLELRPYQLEAIESIRQAIRDGHKRIVLQSPTGSGKTACAANIVKSAYDKNKKAYFVCDRIELIEQAVARFDAEDIPLGVCQADHERTDRTHRIQVSSIQTMTRRECLPASLYIIDECFVAGTKISTPNGEKLIESLRCGDTVYNQCGLGTVESVSIRPATDIFTLELDDGSTIECTGNHRFFTESGWKKARELDNGTYFFNTEAMRSLWERVWSMDEVDGSRGNDPCNQGKGLERAKMLLSVVLEEIKKPNERPSSPVKSASEAEGNASQTYKARRERAIAAFAAIGASSCSRGRVGIGICDTDKKEQLCYELPDLLQDRRSESIVKNRDRDRRHITYVDSKERTGHEKDGLPYFPRLVNISSIKRESAVSVFNLQISGHPSYFANGIAVHNCHALHKAHVKLMADNPDAIFIGLSATPWAKGMGKHFTKLIIVSTPQKLIDEGFLVPMHVYGPSKPDLSKVKIIAGEYEEAGLAEATNTKVLIGNIVETWQKLASDRQTLAFAVNIAHSLSIVEAFQAAGVRAAHLDCHAKSDDRESAIRDLKEGRTQILSSCTLLTKGFDYPGASCAILARPTKSLMLNDQMIGRVLRIAPGKDDGALILDHAGNTERHGFVTDERPTELDDGRKKSVKDAKKDERLPKPCPSCHYLKIIAKCPRCGFQAARQAKDVEHVDGELQLLKGTGSGSIKAKKVKLYTTGQKADIYAQLLGYAKAKGYKDGWCYYKHKELTGTFPARKVAPKEPTPEILGKIKWLNIRNSKRKNKQAALELMDL